MSTAAQVLVVCRARASSASRGSLMWQTTSLSRGSRDRMIPVAVIEESHRIGAPFSSARLADAVTSGGEGDVGGDRGIGSGMDHPHHDVLHVGREAIQVRLLRG
jgi:hypothetical protein